MRQLGDYPYFVRYDKNVAARQYKFSTLALQRFLVLIAGHAVSFLLWFVVPEALYSLKSASIYGIYVFTLLFIAAVWNTITFRANFVSFWRTAFVIQTVLGSVHIRASIIRAK